MKDTILFKLWAGLSLLAAAIAASGTIHGALISAQLGGYLASAGLEIILAGLAGGFLGGVVAGAVLGPPLLFLGFMLSLLRQARSP